MNDKHLTTPAVRSARAAEHREAALTDAVVSVVNSLVDGFDLRDLHLTLTRECVRLLDVDGAELLLADADGVLHVAAASTQAIRDLELHQLRNEEGPCLDCFRSGTAVIVPDLGRQAGKWPRFVAAAGAAGFSAVHALPIWLRDLRLGALGLFGSVPGALSEQDLRLARALAQAAGVAVVADRAVEHRSTNDEQLQAAVGNRIAIEQAKGLLAQAGGLEVEPCFEVLRRFARDHNQRALVIARLLITRELSAAAVIEHARARNVLPGTRSRAPRPGPFSAGS